MLSKYYHFIHRAKRPQWLSFLEIIRQLTVVLLPGKSRGWRSLAGCSPWGLEESYTTERLHFHFHALEKEMATHSSILAWRIPGMGEPGGLPFPSPVHESESEVAQSCLILHNPMDCSLPGSSAHGIFQARVLVVGCHCLLHKTDGLR